MKGIKKKKQEEKKNKKILIVILIIIIFLFLFLLCKCKRYTVTLSVNDKKYYEIDEIKKGETVKEPEEPKIEGYTFAGWFYDDEKFDFSTPITENIELEAKWITNTYFVTIHTGAGYIIHEEVNYNDVLEEPETPYKKGYTFVGWFNGEEEYDFNEKVTEDLKLEAKWSKYTRADYTVEHYLMDRNGNYAETPYETETLKGQINEKVSPKTKEYKGYTSPSREEVKISADGDTLVKYYYEINTYTLTTKGDKGVKETTGDGTYFYNDKVEVNYSLKPGYTFSKYSETLKENIFTMQDENTTILVITTPNIDTPYKVIHYLMDLNGNYSDTPNSIDELTGTTDTFIIPITKVIEGFESPKEETVNVDGDGNRVVKYYYERNKYALNLEAGKGIEATSGSGSYFYEKTVTVSAALKEGYEFEEWSNGETSLSFEYRIPSKNETLTATAKPITYDINYTLNDGTINGTNKDEYTVETEDFTLINPTKLGYTFVGWSLNGSDPVETLTIETGTTGELNIEAIFTPNTNTKYTVEHYQMTLDGTYSDTPTKTEELFGTTDTTIIPSVENYEGFTSPTPSQLFIKADGTAVITYNYVRNEYTLTLNKDTGVSSVTGSGTYYYGETVDITTEFSEGYEFESWSNGTTTQDFEYTVPAENKTLTVYAKPTTYDINYTLNGGTINGTNRDEYTIETEDFTLINPTKLGYTFIGWSLNGNDPVETLTIETGTIGDLNIEAIFEVITYDINYTLNDGTINGTNKDEYTVETEDFTLINPTKLGYTFVGWSLNGSDAVETLTIETGTTGELNIEAVFTPNTNTKYVVEHYQMTLDGTYSDTPTKTEELFGTTDATIIPAVENYKGFTSPTPSQLLIKADGTAVLEYKYVRNEYTLTVEKGYGINEVTETQDYYFGTEVTLTATPLKGHSFVNWTLGENILGTDTTLVYTISDENVTIKVNGKVNYYNVIFNSNGGSAVATFTNYYGGAITKPSDPTREGYTFSGWFSNQELTNAFDFETNTIIDEDITLYAKWTVNSSTIAFDTLGGSEIKPIVQDFGTTVTTPTNPTKEGYTFVNWYTENTFENVYTFTTMPAEGIILYAKWTPNTYTVTFDSNGDNVSGAMSNQEFVYDVSETLNINEYSKLGYTFKGWSLTTNGEVKYLDQALVNNLVPKDSITLYAIWELNEYEITYELNGGTASNKDSYTVETEDFTLINPIKTGYTFVGWKDGDNTPTTTYTVSKGSTGDLSLEAVFEVITYDINYTLNDGTINGTNKDEYTVETEDFTLINPTKLGYTFVGWSLNSNDPVEALTIETGTTGELNIEAVFTPNTNTKYTVEHYQMTLDGTYSNTPTKTEELFGTTDTTIIPSVENYEGFTSPTPSQLFIKADGTAVIVYEYSRNEYTLTLNKDTGVSSVTGSGTYYYGDTVDITTEFSEGYEFESWSNGATTQDFEYTVPAENETLTVYAKPTTYDINYTLNSGTINGTNKNEYTIETEDFTLINPTKTGYTFIGWSLNGSAPVETLTIETGTTGDLNIEAIFTPNTNTKYTVEHYLMTLDGTYSENPTSTTEHTGTTDTTIKAIVGTFEGFTSPLAKDIYIKPDGTAVITYNYVRNEYTLTLNKDTGVSSVIGSGTYYYGDTVDITTEFSEGYEFESWSNGATTQDFEYTVPAENKTLTVYAKPIIYDINYTLNGGTINGTNRDEYTIETEDFTLINPTKTGYTFIGWSLNGSAPVETLTIETGTTGELNIEAIFTPNTNTKYTVEHYLMTLDGTYSENPTSTTEHTGTTDTTIKAVVGTFEGFTSPLAKDIYIKPDGTAVITYNYVRIEYDLVLNKGTGIKSVTGAGPHYYGDKVQVSAEVNAGYEFESWSNGVTTSSFEYTVPAASETLTANAKPITYEIEYTLNGGTINGTNKDEYTIETEDFTLINPTKEGHAFVGWSLNGSDAVETLTIETGTTGDLNIEAIFTPNAYNVQYNGNTSTSGSMGASTHTYGVESNLTSNGFKKEYSVKYDLNYETTEKINDLTVAYTFSGWSTTSTGEVEYNDGASVKTLTNEANKTVNLYAQWTYPTVNLETPTRKGYVFGGWSTTADGTNIIDSTYVFTENTTLYAKWMLIPVIESLTFDLYNNSTAPLEKYESTDSYVKGDGVFYIKLPTDKYLDMNSLTFTTNTPITLNSENVAADLSTKITDIIAVSDERVMLTIPAVNQSKYFALKTTDSTKKTWTVKNTTPLLQNVKEFIATLKSYNIGVAKNFGLTEEGVGTEHLISRQQTIGENVFFFFYTEGTPLVKVEYIRVTGTEQKVLETVYVPSGSMAPNIGKLDIGGFDHVYTDEANAWYTSSSLNETYNFNKSIYANTKVYGNFIVNEDADTDWYTNNPSAQTFTICTKEELLGFAALAATENFTGKTVKLRCNIDLNSENTNPWKPITTFNGTFDGDYYEISNLNITTTSLDSVGFFSSLSSAAKVQNIKFKNVTINSTSNIGTVVGISNGADLYRIYVEGISIKGQRFIGGLIGRVLSGTTVKECAIVKSSDSDIIYGTGADIGGMIGYSNGTVEFTDLYSNVNVKTDSERAQDTGGILSNYTGGTNNLTMRNVIYTGKVSPDTSCTFGNLFCSLTTMGAIYGRIDDGDMGMSNNDIYSDDKWGNKSRNWFYDSNNIGLTQSSYLSRGTDKTTAQLQLAETYVEVEGDKPEWSRDIWTIEGRTGYPMLKWIVDRDLETTTN